MIKIKLQIKNRWTGSILFKYKKENNTIKDTVIEAVRSNADLSNADLRGADLGGADLSFADLRGVYLRGAYLRDADLRGADLRGADLRGADLGGAYLSNAYLSNADLSNAYLRVAYLRGVYLRGADLSNADLRGVYLRGADLSNADLSNADLKNADLRGVDLSNAKNTPFVPFACPSDGAFIGWKKVRGKLVKILIPADAKRCSADSQKCRCDKALVLAITDYDETNPISEIENTCYYPHVTYKVGEMVIPDSFDEDRWNECSHGIHFFINKHDAINY